ncbi:MAG: aminoacyl-histidine dipeptidase [Bacteroidota bacterium]|jgi:dipeptidase D|nr:aminoacyl-histidine dipeptidase [Bacteroidales bacterium]MDI9536118.1 aminoacyl-histidine dipeptidase [Bacteroidota bacterium]OQC45451.1 MAG: Cytosol non-specific dipeptidase [Bacteroidetes bacterium ADurb.Bin028]NLP20987.1 aminoacyl-histidine dipeptidase [Bacteroidales bacterium]HNY44556.1 aminoacyl-histidine dipeptidase [Bacteroidales bacterium]
MSEIKKLNPERVWKHFYSLTQIPRPSKKEEKVIEFMKNFGESLGLETIVDHIGNVIIRKPASPGMENRKGVVLQGHLDMVPQKNSDKVHDFEKDPIETMIDGEWVKANGTTLGADNGMGCAVAMAVLEDKSLVHGPIEALFTIDEETGMTGANHLKPGLLKGDILLNLDSEDEGELYVGCAGGVDVNVTMNYPEVDMPKGFVAYKLSVTGLKGGHSGMDINIGRANSNKILFRFLTYATHFYDLRIAEINGGSLRNAIPRESFAIVAISEKEASKFEGEVAKFEKIFKQEFSKSEPDLQMKVEKTNAPAKIMANDEMHKICKAVYACPHGVQRMSDAMPGLVETSNNLAIVKCINGKFAVHCLVRSSVDTAKEGVMYKIGGLFNLIGAEVAYEGAYPGWKPNMDSPILKTMLKTYEKLYNKTPEIKAIHAGLECGILGAAYPNWDMISFGPTIRYPHSPDERILISSVEKFWNYMVETLKNIPVKE